MVPPSSRFDATCHKSCMAFGKAALARPGFSTRRSYHPAPPPAPQLSGPRPTCRTMTPTVGCVGESQSALRVPLSHLSPFAPSPFRAFALISHLSPSRVSAAIASPHPTPAAASPPCTARAPAATPPTAGPAAPSERAWRACGWRLGCGSTRPPSTGPRWRSLGPRSGGPGSPKSPPAPGATRRWTTRRGASSRGHGSMEITRSCTAPWRSCAKRSNSRRKSGKRTGSIAGGYVLRARMS